MKTTNYNEKCENVIDKRAEIGSMDGMVIDDELLAEIDCLHRLLGEKISEARGSKTPEVQAIRQPAFMEAFLAKQDCYLGEDIPELGFKRPAFLENAQEVRGAVFDGGPFHATNHASGEIFVAKVDNDSGCMRAKDVIYTNSTLNGDECNGKR
jgi:hypothetical protein